MAAFKSQFHTSESETENKTFISSAQFMNFISARAMEYGQKIGAIYGEGFVNLPKTGN